MPDQSRSILIINRKILQGAIFFKVLIPNAVLVNNMMSVKGTNFLKIFHLRSVSVKLNDAAISNYYLCDLKMKDIVSIYFYFICTNQVLFAVYFRSEEQTENFTDMEH